MRLVYGRSRTAAGSLRWRRLAIVFLAVGTMPNQHALTQELSEDTCGDPFDNGVGPYDYMDPIDRTKLDRIPIVEQYHFNRKVESLEGGMTSSNVLADLDYTLRAVPNHHRALYAVSRYELRMGSAKMKPRTAACYFDRAMKFRPKDANVYLIFGIFLHQSGKQSAALEQYTKAIELDGSMAEAYYNLGLLYLDMDRNEEALMAAKSAYKLGYPLQGLKNKLVGAGYWTGSPE